MQFLKKLSILLAVLLLTLPSCVSEEKPSDTVAPTEPTETPGDILEESTACLSEDTTAENIAEKYPKTVFAFADGTSHVQGIALDKKKGHMYFSFTTVLVKTDLDGNVIGTVKNLEGHLGDIDFNEENRRLYGSLEFKSKNAFYIAVFDVDKINKEGIDARSTDLMKVIALPEVTEDFTATVNGNKYRYGCSGIDGVAFGRDFGADDFAPYTLMVAYGVFKDNGRQDNDYQVLMSFDLEKLSKYEMPFDPGASGRNGPRSERRYFIYTGNTNYGVQNLEYDEETGYWFMAVYKGSKSSFPNYALFAADSRSVPKTETLKGVTPAESGLVVPLAEGGLTDAKTGITGWSFSQADTGLVSVGDGYFYVGVDGKQGSVQLCDATLYRFVGGKNGFEIVE